MSVQKYQFVKTGKIYKVDVLVKQSNTSPKIYSIELEDDTNSEDDAIEQAKHIMIDNHLVNNQDEFLNDFYCHRYEEIVANPIERDIGSVFKIGNVSYSVELGYKDKCSNCYFMKEICGFLRKPIDHIGSCENRKDERYVYFKKI